MTERTDHTAEARSLIAWGEDFESEAGRPDASQISSAVHSLTHATLALVEQQRIANLIALAGLRDIAGFENEIYDARLEALMAGLLDRREAPAVAGYGPAGIDEQTFIRPEIAATLGINPEGDPR